MITMAYVLHTINGHQYWYYHYRDGSHIRAQYVGKATSGDIGSDIPDYAERAQTYATPREETHEPVEQVAVDGQVPAEEQEQVPVEEGEQVPTEEQPQEYMPEEEAPTEEQKELPADEQTEATPEELDAEIEQEQSALDYLYGELNATQEGTPEYSELEAMVYEKISHINELIAQRDAELSSQEPTEQPVESDEVSSQPQEQTPMW